VTAGFPTRDATVPIMLAMQAGGADVIELGVPFSDPIADGPVIQAANTVGPIVDSNTFVNHRKLPTLPDCCEPWHRIF
jgi:tryptophan synthase